MQLYYVHDPMCSWCWAFRPILLELTRNLPSNIEFIKLLGGLAPDNDAPMPQETREYVISNWQKIQEEVPDTAFNYDFWENCEPRRSTYPACRAVIAARKQGKGYDDHMTYAIQQAYYLQARNPSDNATLIELANEIELNVEQFTSDLNFEETNEELYQELNTARSLQLNSFPSLLLIKGKQSISIPHNYHDANVILDTLKLRIKN